MHRCKLGPPLSAICGAWVWSGGTDSSSVTHLLLTSLLPHGSRSVQQTSSATTLGQRLLPVTPEDEFERQPLSFPAPGIASPTCYLLVADVRLDNRAELAEVFSLSPLALASTPDSALLLQAWLRWNQGCLQHLAGSFAFAVWDAALQQLFLARDHAGDRPLYYIRTTDLFAFATSARALRTLPGVSGELDERQLARDLLGLPPEPPYTRFRDIRALAPGHCLLVESRATQRPRRYWDILHLRPIRYAHDHEYVDHFNELFDEAVRCRLRTTGVIATELSAGLDSGAVAATAARLLALEGRSLSAYTAVPRPDFSGLAPGGLIADEGPYAAEVAALYPNMTHHLVDASASNMLRELDRIFPWLDIPHAAALNSVWSNLILDRAHDAGANVLLAGSLGNFAVSYSGAEILHTLFRHGRLSATLREAWRLRKLGLSSGRNAASLTVFSLLPWLLRRRMDPLIRAVDLDWTALNPAPAAEYDALDQVRRYSFERHSHLPGLMESQFQRNQYGDYNAATSAGWGIDVRDPTADRRVFEFCASIPPEQFLVGNQGRSLIRRAMRDRLPESTLTRTEKGTQAADWYESLGAIRTQLLAELKLEQQSPAATRLVNLDLLRGALEAYPASPQEALRKSGLYQSAVPRGMAVAYFIRRVEAERLTT